MAITWLASERTANIVTLRVSSSLSDPYYHWYLEGAWLGVTRVGEFSLVVDVGEQLFVQCLDTTDPAFDPVANAPEGYPARRTLVWTASADADIDYYRIEQSQDGGDWTELALVSDDGSWYYRYLTARLEDLATYQWRITPVDTAGNDGTAIARPAEKVIRRPDAVAFAITFNAGATTVTFAEAS